MLAFSLLQLKSLELKMAKSHFIKFEISPTMHFALNSSQPVLCIFRQRTVKVRLPEVAFSQRATFFGLKILKFTSFGEKNDLVQISQSKLPNYVTQQQFVVS